MAASPRYSEGETRIYHPADHIPNYSDTMRPDQSSPEPLGGPSLGWPRQAWWGRYRSTSESVPASSPGRSGTGSFPRGSAMLTMCQVWVSPHLTLPYNFATNGAISWNWISQRCIFPSDQVQLSCDWLVKLSLSPALHQMDSWMIFLHSGFFNQPSSA